MEKITRYEIEFKLYLQKIKNKKQIKQKARTL